MDSESDLELKCNSNSLKNYSEDIVDDSDIIYTKTSFSRYPSNDDGSQVSNYFDKDQQSYKFEDFKTEKKNNSWKISDRDNSSKDSKNKKKNSGNKFFSKSNSQHDLGSEYDFIPSPKQSPKVKNIHAPISSSIFSQNHLNSNIDQHGKNKNQFLSRQISALDKNDETKEIKKSKTLEESYKVNSPKMVIKILKPENFDLDNVNIQDMIKKRNIMGSNFPSVRSNLNNILKNKKLSKNNQREVNSDGLDSIKETSVNSKLDRNSSGKKKSNSQEIKSKKGNITVTSASMSHFEFHDHNDFKEQLDGLSKDALSRLNKTGNISESSGIQYMINTKFSEQKDFLSGVGSLNNLTQYIDYPYMNLSKHASRLSRDFQTQDNISLFKEDLFQCNLEEITKRTGRLSIENFFSNIKKNPKFDMVAEPKLESIQGPYFTGKHSEKNILIQNTKGILNNCNLISRKTESNLTKDYSTSFKP
jgi:hypothetical protein